MHKQTRCVIATTTLIGALALGMGTASPAGAKNPGPPDIQLGVLTAASASPGAELQPGLVHAIDVLAAVPAVQYPPNPCTAPGYGILTTHCDG